MCRRVINASGVVLHTGLGRARLAHRAVEAIKLAAEAHSDVELDLASGKRGDRQDILRDQLRELTGADDALVVNNCAGAVLLALAATAGGGDVILARGQMVEIGGSFRMPDIVRRAGCRLVEVGCTNKVRLSDYAEAISPRTKAILRCHPSNFRVVGFTEEPSIEELAALAKESDIALIDDTGSGCLVDSKRFGFEQTEPILGDSLRRGAHLETASGDKLLGGPQSGLIIGSRERIEKCKKHPLARALRIDKLTRAALSATLQLYQLGLEDQIPTIRSLSRSVDSVREDAETLAKAHRLGFVEAGSTEVGGGSLPGLGVPSVLCGIRTASPKKLAEALRMSDPAIVGRVEKGCLWLDPRTMTGEEVELAASRLKELD